MNDPTTEPTFTKIVGSKLARQRPYPYLLPPRRKKNASL